MLHKLSSFICPLNLFPLFVSPFLRCFSSLFSHLLSLMSLPFLFILYSTEAETDARAASEERKKREVSEHERERERARERECRSVCPCGFRMNSVCVRERETVSEPVREKQTERMRERFADWLAGSAVRGARDWRECDPCQVSGVRDLHQLD